MRWTFVCGVVLCLIVGGCGEIHNRGGLVDQIGDKYLFQADGKAHRALRSYAVLASLVGVARQRGIRPDDRVVVAGHIEAALDVMGEAFTCAYESTVGCAYFDEKMARLDYRIYKLALLTLVDEDGRQFMNRVKDEMLGYVPVLGSGARAVLRAADVVQDSATATVEATRVVDTMLRVSFFAVETGAHVMPLYRDAIELDMRVVVDALARMCGRQAIGSGKYSRSDVYDADQVEKSRHENCIAFRRGFQLYANGNGDLREWRAFLKNFDRYPYITPSGDHFYEVERFLYAACGDLLADNKKQCQGKLIYAKWLPDASVKAAAYATAARLSRGSVKEEPPVTPSPPAGAVQ